MSKEDINNRINRAIEYQKAGVFPEAEVIYRNVLNDDPENASALNLLGMLIYQLGNYDEALEYVNRAIDICEYAYFYKNLGNIYMAKFDVQAAKNCFERAKELEGEDFQILFSLAGIYKSLGDKEKALEYYEKVLKIQPGLIEVYCNLGNMYLDDPDNIDKAVNYFEMYLEKKPKDIVVYYNYIKALEMKKQYQKAFDAYNKIISFKPNAAKAYVGLGNLFLMQNKKEEAIEYFEMATQINPNNKAAVFGLKKAKAS